MWRLSITYRGCPVWTSTGWPKRGDLFRLMALLGAMLYSEFKTTPADPPDPASLAYVDALLVRWGEPPRGKG